MKAQFKYAFRQSLGLKAAALAELALMNLVFGILGYYRLWGKAGMITAVVLSSLAFCGMLAVRAIVDGRYFKDVFSAPDGYLYALTPVKSWKILLARVTAIVCEDCVCLFIGIFGIVWQALVLSGELGAGINFGGSIDIRPQEIGYILSGGVLVLLGYTYLTVFGVFGASLKNSVLFGVRGRAALAALGVLAAAWALNLLNFAAAPFGEITRWKFFFNISLPTGYYAWFAVNFLLYSAKTAALFAASCVLMERKNNL